MASKAAQKGLKYEPVEKIPDGGAERRGCNFWASLSPDFSWADDFLHSRLAQIGRLDCLSPPWKLAEEVAGMHFPAPLASAVAATFVQFICSLFIIIGLFTRINAILLFGALSGAILQNLLAGRDPQLAILYTLVVLTLAFMGGGRISLDAKLSAKAEQSPSRNAGMGRELRSI